MDENIYDLIKENKSKEVEEQLAAEEQNFLLFSINSKKYALSSNFVRELLKDIEVFPLPFVPSYIDGVLNRYGDSYAVIEPAYLFNDSKQESSLFLVFNDENKICIRISDVYDFHTIPVSSIRTFTEDDSSKYFEGIFKYNDDDVLIIRKDSVVEKIEKDFERF